MQHTQIYFDKNQNTKSLEETRVFDLKIQKQISIIMNMKTTISTENQEEICTGRYWEGLRD